MLALWLNLVRLLRAIARSWSHPHFQSGLLLVGLVLLSGTVFYSTTEGWHWVDALYFCVTTISTVGMGDLAPRTQIGKLFTVVYVLVGVGVFVTLLSQIARAMLSLDDD